MGSLARISAGADAEAFGAGQNEVLQLIAEGASLREALEAIVSLIERQSEGMLCSILLVDERDGSVRHAAAPNLPREYVEAVDGRVLAPDTGTCGPALHRRERVITEDIATDPCWARYSDLALPHGLVACWSSPIFGREGEVLGTFGMYYRQRRGPTESEKHWVDVAVHLASIAVARERQDKASQRLMDDLAQRVRQLMLLHQTTRLLQSGRAFERELLSELVGLLPEGLCHPDRCEARITWGELELTTPGFSGSPARLRAEFGSGQRRGAVEVEHREPGAAPYSAFIDEERELLRSIADLLSAHVARLESEQALRRSEQRLRATIESTPDVAMQWFDEHGRLVYCNQASAKLFGWDAAQARGRTLSELGFSAAEVERFMQLLSEVARTGAPVGPQEFEYRRPDGSPGVLRSTTFRIPLDEGESHYACTDIDLTERKAMEEAVRANERLLAIIYETVSNGLCYLAVEALDCYRFVSVNPAFLRATGIPREAVVGHLLHEVVREPDVLARLLAKLREAIAERRVITFEEESEFPAGRRWGEITVTPIFDDGRCSHLVGSVHDLTRRKQVEQEQRRLERDLMQAERMRALGTLAGGIAHDFNNILTAISGHTLLALQDIPPEHVAYESLWEIKKASRRATDLVRQILAFSRKQPSRRTTIDLCPLIADAFKLLRAAAPADVRLELELSPTTPLAHADPTQAHQAVMNLATNGLQAMAGRGGVLKASTAEVVIEPGAAGSVPGLEPGRYARLTIADSGKGMDERTLAHAFEPFFTTNAPGNGTGLGLSVVHGIMTAHDGAVTVTSKVGEGSSFDLYFPASADQPAAARSEPPPAMAAGGEHVLYVDDEQALVVLAKRMLERFGYRVTAYADPLQALDDFRKRPEAFDAVVTDLSMPGLSGLDLTRELFALRADVPVIMTSGHLRVEDKLAADALGIKATIAKPNTMDELARALHEVLASRRKP